MKTMSTNQNKLSNVTIGYILSFAVTSIFNGLLVIIKESNESVMNFMKNLFGHHWITHGIFDIVLFLLLGFIFSKSSILNKFNVKNLSNIVIWSSIIGIALIVGFILID